MSWDIVKLDDICNVITCGVAKRPEYQDSGIPFLSSLNVKENRFILTSFKYISEKDHEQLTKYSKPEKGDILYTRVGSFGEAAVIDLDFEFSVFVSLTLIKPKHELVDSRFLMWHLNSPDVKSFANNNTSGIGVQNLNVGVVREFKIPLPPLPIQKRIAEILDAADALKRKDQTLLKKYDELAQAIFIDMFGTNTNVVKLNQITTKITDGVHAKPNYQDTGVPFLSVKNATNKFLDFENSKFITETDHYAYTRRCKPEFEDILYTKVGATYGRSAIIDSKKEFSIYVSLALIKPDRSKVYPYYLNFVLNTNYVKSQADRRVKGAGVPDLHLVEIKDFDIPLPSYKEQLDFSNVIENLNKNISNTKRQIIHGDNLFQTLIQKAFNGELVVE